MQFPEIYKDPNHKPEVAISLDDNFLALDGFGSSEMIYKNLTENKALRKLFFNEESVPEITRELVKHLIEELMTKVLDEPGLIESVIKEL
mmetsp:Transcript_15790/g.11462  ORF Transcript_15790/g.11462 Transcript_15790/m.11462 type:complete len:90 (+) Transcript_15790:329-598(+)|eukprot:CAMPEP_0202959870 /NCGR_PEP_ID=MMETSP1396-20130829/4057_1 /ASSEMBLY_ACC=CAM_ASM_000872 /TAXON_ID= /ORGANISM="Pseudokeronopsis sp., Strain Brazil" /LENGTH=89 /DNA_ID=CAMNT_0049678719 /DNA_START=323 /DNA_END=592 /DNA_ORIENTATION=+